MSLRLSGRDTDSSEVDHAHRYRGTTVTPDGMVSDSRAVHSRNAPSPIVFKDEGSVRDSSEVQPKNAYSPIVSNPSGNIT